MVTALVTPITWAIEDDRGTMVRDVHALLDAFRGPHRNPEQLDAVAECSAARRSSGVMDEMPST